MSTQKKFKPATSRQIEYITRLHKETGNQELKMTDAMISHQASGIITEFVSKASRNKNNNNQGKNVNEQRLGIAIKECFRIWKNHGWDIYGKHRNAFIKEAIMAYNLFTDITEALNQESNLR